MQFLSTLLQALATHLTLVLANPLRVDVSLETTEGFLVPIPLDKGSVITEPTIEHPSAVLFSEPGFGGELQVYDRSDSGCLKIVRELRTAFQSVTIIGYCACSFYKDSDFCEEPYFSGTVPGGYHGYFQNEAFTSFRCTTSCEESHTIEVLEESRNAASAQLDSSKIGLSHVAMSPPGYKDTAKIIFWNDLKFTGSKKRYQVFDDKCYDFPKDFVNYVVSAKFEPKVWYCTFYPKESCQAEEGSDEVHQLPAGEYDFLFPEGMDFVSFKCKLYDNRPESPPSALSSISAADDSNHRRPSSFQTVMSLPKSKTIKTAYQFGFAEPDSLAEQEVKTFVPSVQLYPIPGFHGPVSNIPYYPGTWGCVPLKTPEEINFHSIRMSPEFRSCSFHSEKACNGDVVLRIEQTTAFVPGTETMSLRTMYCSFES